MLESMTRAGEDAKAGRVDGTELAQTTEGRKRGRRKNIAKIKRNRHRSRVGKQGKIESRGRLPKKPKSNSDEEEETKSVISHKSEATANSDDTGKTPREKAIGNITISIREIGSKPRETRNREEAERESISSKGSDESKEPQEVEATEEEKERQRESFGDTLARQEEADGAPKIDESTLSNEEEKMEKEGGAESEAERERENDEALERWAKKRTERGGRRKRRRGKS